MKNGWQTKTLASVASKITDGSHNPPKGGAQSDYLMLSSKNVFDDDLHYEGPRYLSREHFQQEDKRTGIAPNDVLLTIVGTVGRSAVVPPNAPRITLQRSVAVIRPERSSVEPRFLMYSFIERSEDLNARARGVAQKGIYLETLRELEVQFPPLPEQQRIVGILDEAFAGIATAKANAEKNLENARAIFESHLQSVFAQRRDGWAEHTLGDIAEFKNGLNYNRGSSGQTVPIVGVADFQDNYFVPISEVESATIDGNLADGYALKQNDILTVRSNGSKHLVGRCMLVGDVDEVTSYSGFIIRIRFDTSKVFPKFLLHFMKCAATRDVLTQGGGGTNITNINQEKLASLPVPLPPYEAQTTIAAALDHLYGETQCLAGIYKRKFAALDGLKKSLLHQAFSGNL